ncbi:MAG: class I SAM-dependent methyltransferase [Vicinamibacterales bacterium]
MLLGDGIFAELAGKVVLDFGCGTGETCVELANRGAKHVVGLDIQEHLLEEARLNAARAGVADRCTFATEYREPVDAVLSMDAFEHFGDPAAVLAEMRRLIDSDGYVIIEFGPTWLHPLGGHLFSVFPWAHLLFSENSLIRWRSEFKHDGATRFSEVAGGLNQMTIRRWERLVSMSDLQFKTYELRSIRRFRWLHNRLTREYLTAVVVARLTPARS